MLHSLRIRPRPIVESVRAALIAIALVVPAMSLAQDKDRSSKARAEALPKASANERSSKSDASVDAVAARLLAASEQKEIVTAMRDLRRLADQGSTKAALIYGKAAAQGQFMPADAAAGERYLRRAAKAGNADAQYALAMLLLKSAGPGGKSGEAIELLRRSASSVPESVYMLALIQARSSADPATAERKVVTTAAESGFGPAQYQLAADMLREAPDKERDLIASQWLQRASDQGQVLATFDLGILYLEGTRVPRDAKKGIALLEIAAEAGLARAEYALGRAYSLGDGVAADHRKAPLYTRRAAAKGLPEAEYSMGFAYTHGVGVPVDEAKAFEWFKLAASHGNVDALNAIGTAYANGYGVGKDMRTAYDWYCKAAQAGHKEALQMVKRQPDVQCNLAETAK